MRPEDTLAQMNLKLAVPSAVGAYVPAVQSGNLVWTSGQLPTVDGKMECTGRVGVEVTLAEAQECAKVAAVNALAAIKGVVGELSRVKRVVQVVGFVVGGEGFSEQHLVLNGASNLLLAALGESGRHTRAAVGVAGLPLGAPVEVMLTVEVTA